ncbi:glycoside hydrolase family 26 protein [Fulvivirga maritima]|uniref:glycoside hydrolase family 26 protein n=1 Tax=Fulvivirga maritima TaxID=2904247 RepID=UPI001F376462|nr:glycosyl hydrolase [Fulvivirga maritima]UII25312.1 glycoside hydrolase family 26 protein [Fulvivirga maritima]
MKFMVKGASLTFFLVIIFSMAKAQLGSLDMVDKNATKKTKILYYNLFNVSEKGFMFGHQDDLAYGIGWWDEPGDSDVKRITGTYPAVFGWDLGFIETGRPFNIDTVDFKSMHQWIKKAYKMGCVNTISWHVNNPVNGNNSWDKEQESVKQILPGGKYHLTYVEYLDRVADFAKKCKAGPFTSIPLIFRPFHEHNGNWFWWGKGMNSEEDYIQLYRFTVTYLRDERKVHNLLYAFSPDRSRLDINNVEESYLYGYPGDDYVDIIGLDNYWDVGHGSNQATPEVQQEQFVKSLLAVSQLAQDKGKVAALTETGSFGVKDAKWFTDYILKPIQSAPNPPAIAWMLVWRNRFKEETFTPYTGHPAVEDFKHFEQSNYTFFADDIQNLYQLNKPLLK